MIPGPAVGTAQPGAIVALLLAALIGGCALPGRPDLQQFARQSGFAALDVGGERFRHRLYRNAGATGGDARRLHLYIDGDGTPWLARGRPAADPTPRNPLVLRLMSLDPSPAVYLGRPCYAGVSDPAMCNPWHWTHGRYSEQVVASMARAAHRIIAMHGSEEIVLIGFSGGGTLAMLLAERLDKVSDVVTLAANLDVAAWTREHDYSPLSASLDPARREPLPGRIRQWHWAGENDREVPPRLIANAIAEAPHIQFEILPGQDHACCWEAVWPQLLQRFDQGFRAGRSTAAGLAP